MAGAKKYFRFDLSKARDGEMKIAAGRYLRVVRASNATCEVEISVDENINDHYEIMVKNGYISVGAGFQRFYVRNEAQAGDWVVVMVVEDRSDYDVENENSGVISSIGQIDDAVKVINEVGEVLEVNDPLTQAAVGDAETAIVAALAALETAVDAVQSICSTVNSTVSSVFSRLAHPTDKRAALIDLTGCTYVNALNTTVTIAAGTNTNGVYIPFISWSAYSTNFSHVEIDDVPICPYHNAGNGMVGTMDALFVPAGKKIEFYSNTVNAPLRAAYKVL